MFSTAKRNKYPSYCLRCECKVGVNHGVLVKKTGPWGNWACRCAAPVAKPAPVAVVAPAAPVVPVELTPAEIAARLAECPF